MVQVLWSVQVRCHKKVMRIGTCAHFGGGNHVHVWILVAFFVLTFVRGYGAVAQSPYG